MTASGLPYVKVAPAPRQRLSDSICEQIERLIAEGTLLPGQALPAERLLAVYLGVSRPSVREALLRLEARELLKLSPRSGFAVSDVSASTITGALQLLLRRQPATARDVLELHQGLELLAAHFAATRANRDDRERLRRYHKRMGEPPRPHDPELDAQQDAEFHVALAQASHNVALIHVMHGLQTLLHDPARDAWEPILRAAGGAERLQAQHRAIVDAVLDNDAARAREVARRHLEFVCSVPDASGHGRRPSVPKAGEQAVKGRRRPG